MKALTTFAALACVVYGIYQIASGPAEKLFKRDIEPRRKACEESVETVRGEKKRWVSDKS